VEITALNTLEAISKRRSIRHFQDRPIPPAMIEQLLEATILAPSAKNVQPWRFVVVEPPKREELTQIMHQKAQLLKKEAQTTGSLEWTIRVMAQAPVTILVLNACPPSEVPKHAHKDWDFVMLQSTGAAIQTMLLAAQEIGLGSLWICDVLYASTEILGWLNHPLDTLVAAVSLGYADEAPPARRRFRWQEVTEWLSS
jgi:nitroreductase